MNGVWPASQCMPAKSSSLTRGTPEKLQSVNDAPSQLASRSSKEVVAFGTCLSEALASPNHTVVDGCVEEQPEYKTAETLE